MWEDLIHESGSCPLGLEGRKGTQVKVCSILSGLVNIGVGCRRMWTGLFLKIFLTKSESYL